MIVFYPPEEQASMDEHQMPSFTRDASKAAASPDKQSLDWSLTHLEKNSSTATTQPQEASQSEDTTPLIQEQSNIAIREEYQEAISAMSAKYIKIYDLLFGYGVRIFLCILALIIAIPLSKTSASLQPWSYRNADMMAREEKLAQATNFINNTHADQKDLRVVIENGELSLDSNRLISIENLLSYQWYTIPWKTNINLKAHFSSLPPSTNFSNANHTPNDVDTFLQAFIFESRTNQNNTKTIQSLPITSNMIDYFWISCIGYPDLPWNFCNNAVNQFIRNFKYYDLTSHYKDLETISKHIFKTARAEEFCGELANYVFISHDTSINIDNLIKQCSPQHINAVDTFDYYLGINDQLEKWKLNNHINNSSFINSYKLLSTMQEIAYEINKGDYINTVLIESYLEYTHALLKKPDALLSYYFDIMARFNNSFLVSKVSDAISSTRNNERYKELLSNIKKINVWDKLRKIPALGDFVSNADYLENKGDYTDRSSTQDTESPLSIKDLATTALKDTPIYILDITQEETTITITSQIVGATHINIANNAPLEIYATLQNNNLLVDSVVMSRNKELAQSLNAAFTTQTVALEDLYAIITDIQTLQYTTTHPEQDICDVFAEETTISCDEQTLIIEQNNIRYEISYDNKKWVTNYHISDPTLQSQLKALYGMPIIATTNPEQAIRLVLWYKLDTTSQNQEPEPQTPSWGFVDIQIQKDINSIGASVQSIRQEQELYRVEFTHTDTGEKFVAYYDFAQRTLTKLSLVVDDKERILRNIRINFQTITESDKDLFANDLKSYLLRYDPISVKQYRL